MKVRGECSIPQQLGNYRLNWFRYHYLFNFKSHLVRRRAFYSCVLGVGDQIKPCKLLIFRNADPFRDLTLRFLLE